MSWLDAESAIVEALRAAAVDAHAVVSRAELVELADPASDARWQGVAVTYDGYTAVGDAIGCQARITQRWTTWCVLWDAEGTTGARSLDSSLLVDAVIGALMGLEIASATSPLTIASAAAPEDDAGSRLLPIAWQITFDVSKEMP